MVWFYKSEKTFTDPNSFERECSAVRSLSCVRHSHVVLINLVKLSLFLVGVDAGVGAVHFSDLSDGIVFQET